MEYAGIKKIQAILQDSFENTPLAAGADKFFNVLLQCIQLGTIYSARLPIPDTRLIKITVGVEILAGIAIPSKPPLAHLLFHLR